MFVRACDRDVYQSRNCPKDTEKEVSDKICKAQDYERDAQSETRDSNCRTDLYRCFNIDHSVHLHSSVQVGFIVSLFVASPFFFL
jgi:5-methylcytosine-specific restriction endonuclease McrA